MVGRDSALSLLEARHGELESVHREKCSEVVGLEVELAAAVGALAEASALSVDGDAAVGGGAAGGGGIKGDSDEVAAVKKQLNDLRAIHVQMQATMDETKDQLTREQTLSGVKDKKLQQCDEMIQALENEKQEIDTECGDLRRNVGDRDATAEQLLNQVTTLQAALHERAEATAAQLTRLESELATSEAKLGAMAQSQRESVAKASLQLQEIAQLQAELQAAELYRTDRSSSGSPGGRGDRSSGGEWSPSASSADENEPLTPRTGKSASTLPLLMMSMVLSDRLLVCCSEA